MNTESNKKDTKIESKTIAEVQSESIMPSGRYGPLVARIPVIISQSKVHVNVNSEICLDHKVIDIRNCTRSVFLTRCSLINMGDKRHGKVHLSGFINENIEYTTSQSVEGNFQSELYFKTIKIPFEFAAKIDYCTRPIFPTPNRFISVSLSSFPNQSASKENFLCQLDESDICEADIIRKNVSTKDLSTFDTLKECLVLSITFTILQWQQVSIPRFVPYNSQ